jgi:hypothetical protein
MPKIRVRGGEKSTEESFAGLPLRVDLRVSRCHLDEFPAAAVKHHSPGGDPRDDGPSG